MNNPNPQEKVYSYNLVDYDKKVPLALITKDSKVNCTKNVFRFTEGRSTQIELCHCIKWRREKICQIRLGCLAE